MMSLLQRIAASGGDPERARRALKLIIQQRLRELGRPSIQIEIDRLFECLEQTESFSGNALIRRLILADLSEQWFRPYHHHTTSTKRQHNLYSRPARFMIC